MFNGLGSELRVAQSSKEPGAISLRHSSTQAAPRPAQSDGEWRIGTDGRLEFWHRRETRAHGSLTGLALTVCFAALSDEVCYCTRQRWMRNLSSIFSQQIDY